MIKTGVDQRSRQDFELITIMDTRMWANAQRDGRPAEYRWRPVLNAAKFGSRPLLECLAVTGFSIPTCFYVAYRNDVY